MAVVASMGPSRLARLGARGIRVTVTAAGRLGQAFSIEGATTGLRT